ncbi:hypothetical protein BDV98DRAFT_587000 [Pterulicium gracile]|uniref:Uncharacterized protein n=1 Tax=Pterulicium gracile TaxID=1884261 RepID=A0A5C3Q3C2_9AGAR|nr:hypothetical protein BDV98DRAFT_587000 [Pterula gracilis]
MSSEGPLVPQTTPTLSLDDIQLLALVGKDIDYAFKTVVAEFAVCGAYFILASMALHTIIKKPLRTARSRLLGSLLIATFLLTTLSCSLDIVYMQARIKPVITVDDPSVSFSEEVQGYGKSSRLRPIFIMTSTMETGGDVGLVFILNDILACWRAMSVWALTSRPFVGALLCFLIFATIGLWIPAVVLDSQIYGASATSNADIFTILAIAGSATSIAANALATGMIVFVA